jgi:hypothetical protein
MDTRREEGERGSGGVCRATERIERDKIRCVRGEWRRCAMAGAGQGVLFSCLQRRRARQRQTISFRGSFCLARPAVTDVMDVPDPLYRTPPRGAPHPLSLWLAPGIERDSPGSGRIRSAAPRAAYPPDSLAAQPTCLPLLLAETRLLLVPRAVSLGRRTAAAP